MAYKRKWLKMLILSIVFCFTTLSVGAETIEDRLNNLMGPEKQYDTYLSSSYIKTQSTEEYVNPRNGELSITQTDYSLPGKNGLDLEFTRIYKTSSANMSTMKVKYVNGAWVDYIESDANASSFYEDRYNLGVGMRFSFPTLEVMDNQDESNQIFLHTETGDVYTLKEYLLNEDDKEEWFNEDIQSLLTTTEKIYLPKGQTVKDVFVGYSKAYSNGTETSEFVLINKNGDRTYFTKDGRILAMQDKFENTISFKYTTMKYTIDGTSVEKKLISEIVDTLGRVITMSYEEDHTYRVENQNNDVKSNSYEETQNPNTLHSGDLEGKFKVIIHLPQGEKIIYDKSAALVSNSGQVIRTRLQTVYDIDGQAKYHYWYEQPSLGFTYHNGTNYSVYNRYEYLVQIDYCKTNEMRRYTYETYKKKLYQGSMEYRKVFQREKLIKKNYEGAGDNFLKRFEAEAKEKEVYKYTNEPDGFGTDGYKVIDYDYLENTYRYQTEITDLLGNKVIKIYDGLHQLLSTELIGNDHKEIIKTEHDELKLINKKETIKYPVVNGEVNSEPIYEIENYRYDKYGNLTSYTGPEAKRDEQGNPVNDEHTVTYSFDYDKYHSLTLKTWKQDADSTAQLIYTLDSKGNVIKSTQQLPEGDIITQYQYDSYGNVIKKQVLSSDNIYTTHYEYGVDINGVDHKGAYLTKEYTIVEGIQLATSFAYDTKGNLIQQRDANGNSQYYTYDSFNRLILMRYPDDTTEEYTYLENPFENFKIIVKDQKGYQYGFEYDIQGKEVKDSLIEDGNWIKKGEKKYDTYGNLIETFDGNGNKTTYTYDSQQRLVKKQYYEGAIPKEAVTLEYQMHQGDAPYETIMRDEDGYQHHFFYDIKGQLVKVRVTPDHENYYEKTYVYDYTGNKISFTDAMGYRTSYVYDAAGRLREEIDPLGNSVYYDYDSANLLRQIIEPGGKISTYIYDDRGLLKEQSVSLESDNEVFYTTYTYDGVGNTTEKTKGKEKDGIKTISEKSSFTYNERNQVVHAYTWLSDTEKNHKKYLYDASGNTTEVVNYTNRDESSYFKDSYTYQAYNLLKEQSQYFIESGVEQTGSHITYNYDNNHNLVEESMLTEKGYVTSTYSYDYRNRLQKKIIPQSDTKNTIIQYTYDGRNNLETETISGDGKDYITLYQYDGLSRMIQVNNPMGYITRYAYDQNGNIIKEVDPRYSGLPLDEAPGKTYSYDANNRIIEESIFDGQQSEVLVQFTYDNRGNMIKKVNSLGYNSQSPDTSIGDLFTYNALDQKATYQPAENVNNNVEIPYSYTYDGSGRQIVAVNPKGYQTSFTYDLAGHMKKTTYSDATEVHYNYDLSGKRWMKTTDQKGNVTEVIFNSFELPEKQIAADGSIMTFAYSPDGKVLEKAHSSGSRTSYNYDLAGNIIREKILVEDGDGQSIYKVTDYTYDIRSLVTRTSVYEMRVDQTTGDETASEEVYFYTYTYDNAGRNTAIKEPEGKETLYEYDKKGNILTTKKKVDEEEWFVTRFTYNHLSQLIKQAVLVDVDTLDMQSIMNAQFDDEYPTKVLSTNTYEYDLMGNVLSLRDPLGNETSYNYNLAGKPVKVTNAMSHQMTYTYDELGNMIKEINALGHSTEYIYDSMGRLIEKIQPFGDGEKASYQYFYDETGKLIKEVQPEQISTLKGKTYEYDNMGRITATYDAEGQLLTRMTYDNKGRLAKKVDGLRDISDEGYVYTYNHQDKLLSVTDPFGNKTEYTYDIQGNVLSKKDALGYSVTYIYSKDNTLREIHYPDGSQESYTYDQLGRVLSKQDPRGNQKQYTYNDFNKVMAEEDALGNKVTYIYDLRGQNLQVIDQVGSKTTFTYDSLGRVIKKEIPLRKKGSQTIYAIEDYIYDEVGNLVSKTIYEKGTHNDLRSLYYTYFDNGQLKTETVTAGPTTHYSYDKNGNVINTTRKYKDDNETIETYQYDSHNRLIEKVVYVDQEAIDEWSSLPNKYNLLDKNYPDMVKLITKYTYDQLGNLIKEELPMGFAYLSTDRQRDDYAKAYTYDALNRVVAINYVYNNEAVTKSFAYDANGNKISDTDEKGHTRSYAYDALNRLVKLTDPLGNSLSYEYDGAGNIIKEINAKGQDIEYTYDALNRVEEVIDAYDVVIETKTYDAKGNLIANTDANGYTTTYSYDLANRLETVLDPEGKDAGYAYTRSYSYNIYGDILSSINGLGEETLYTYDARGLLTEVINPLGVSTRYTYDAMGNKISKIDGLGRETQYSYSKNGHLLVVTNPLGETIHYAYDLMGNIVKEIDKKGQTLLYTFDNLRRLTEKRVIETGDTIGYAYDVLGNRTKMEDGTGSTTYTYDANNHLLEKAKDGAAQITYSYDVLGNISLIETEGRQIEYAYDESNRMETVLYNGGVTTYTYDKAGNRESVEYSNGVKISYDYDKNNRVVKITNSKGMNNLSTLNYTYDLVGRKLSKENHMGITNYTYDQAGRLTKEEAPGYTTTYTYDHVGNRIIKQSAYNSLQPTSFEYTDSGEIASYKTQKSYYIYNEADQLIKTTEKMYDEAGVELLKKKTTFTYDSNGNQTSQYSNFIHPYRITMRQKVKGEAIKEEVTEEGISTLIDRVTYSYDGFNRLLAVDKVVDGERNIVTFNYDGDGLRTEKIEKTSSNNYTEVITGYTYDRQHVIIEKDETGVKTFYLRGINYIAKETDSMSYYLYNGHGDVIQTVDEAGNILNQYVYDAFGNETFTHEVEENAIRYSGEFFDASTGLYYLRARYYNPYIGRFISEDSYWGEDANPASLNLYTYCHNDPVNYVDPSGHFISSILKGISNVIKTGIDVIKKNKTSSNRSNSSSNSNKRNAESVSNEADVQSRYESNTDSPITRIMDTVKGITNVAMGVMLPSRASQVITGINLAFDRAIHMIREQERQHSQPQVNNPEVNNPPSSYTGIREYLRNNYNVPDEMIGWSNDNVKIYNTELNLSNIYLDTTAGKSYALPSEIDAAYKKFSGTYDSMVQEVQRNLIILGYDLNQYGADGMLGMKGGETVEALKQFQRDTLNEQANLRKTLDRVEDFEMNGLSEYKELMEMNIGVTGGITSDTIEALRFKVKRKLGNDEDEVEDNEKEIIEEITTEGINDSDAYALPIKEGTITQLYSPTSHHGLDIGVVEGTPIYAITDGTLNIRINGNNPDTGYGYYVYLDFEYGGSNENRAIYGHLMNDLPDEIIEGLGGDPEEITNDFQIYNGATIRVEKGQIIGYTSNTGVVYPPESGYHLHFTLQLEEADDRSEKADFSWENSVDPLTRFNFFDFPMYDSVKKVIDSSEYLSKYNEYRLD